MSYGIGVFVCVTTFCGAYFVFGHWLIKAMYQKELFEPLNRIILEKGLGGALKSADLGIAKVWFYSLILSLVLVMPTNWKLALLSGVFLLTILEAGLRVHDLYLDYRYMEEKKGTGLFEPDPLLGWKNKANFETYYSGRRDQFRNLVKTNSKGLRDDEYGYEKPDGTKRILLLGDSVVAGLEVPRENVIDVKLEKLLEKNGTYEVINTGVQAYGTDQQYLYLKTEGYKYSPDMIIHVAVSNDPTENITIHQRQRGFGKAYFILEDGGQLVLSGIPIPKFEKNDPWVMAYKEAERFYGHQGEINEGATLFEEYKESGSLFALLCTSLKQDLSHLVLYQRFRERIKGSERIKNLLVQWNILSHEEVEPQKPEAVRKYEYQIHEKLLEALRDLSRSLNAKFLVYEFTNGMGEMPHMPTDVQKICQNFGIEYLNSFKAFYETSHGKPVYGYRYDGHWNSKGHRSAAEAIYQFLLEKQWV